MPHIKWFFVFILIWGISPGQSQNFDNTVYMVALNQTEQSSAIFQWNTTANHLAQVQLLDLSLNSIAREELSTQEIELLTKIIQEERPDVSIDQFLENTLDWTIQGIWWLDDTHALLIGRLESCISLYHYYCFGHYEFGILNSIDSSYTLITKLNLHSATQSEMMCRYDSTIQIGEVYRDAVYQIAMVPIKGIPLDGCFNPDDVMTLVFDWSDSTDVTVQYLPYIAGLSVSPDNTKSAYYQVGDCDTDFRCYIALSMSEFPEFEHETVLQDSAEQPIKFDDALLLNTTWLNNDALYYDWFDTRTIFESHRVYQYDLSDGVVTSVLSKEDWFRHYQVGEALVIYKPDRGLQLAYSPELIGGKRILDVTSNAMVFTDDDTVCLTSFSILDPEQKITHLDIPAELLANDICISSVSLSW